MPLHTYIRKHPEILHFYNNKNTAIGLHHSGILTSAINVAMNTIRCLNLKRDLCYMLHVKFVLVNFFVRCDWEKGKENW